MHVALTSDSIETAYAANEDWPLASSSAAHHDAPRWLWRLYIAALSLESWALKRMRRYPTLPPERADVT